MMRLPADGKSVQSRSSGSIQSTPSLSAAPAAEKTKEPDGGHDEAGHSDAGNHPLPATPVAEPVPSAGISVPVLDEHEAVAGLTGDEERQEVEKKESEGEEATIPKIELVDGESDAVTTTAAVADPAAEADLEAAEELGDGKALAGQVNESQGKAVTPELPPLEQDRKSDREADGAHDSEANPEEEEVMFIPSKCFTGAKLGYVFKTGDKGLGFYVEGYVDQPVRGKLMSAHRPWNAGPGELAIRRGPLGPIPKPFMKIVPFRTREEKKAAEESDR